MRMLVATIATELKSKKRWLAKARLRRERRSLVPWIPTVLACVLGLTVLEMLINLEPHPERELQLLPSNASATRTEPHPSRSSGRFTRNQQIY